jgi:hypothetical protein
MEEEKKSSPKGKVNRYQYIGFDVYPGKAKEFWKSNQEKKTFLEKTKKGRKREDQDHSLVYVNIFTQFEKTIISISSLIIIVCFFLPWFALEKGSMVFKYSGLGYILNFGFLSNYSALSTGLAGLFITLLLITLIASFLAGIGTLFFVYKKVNPLERYYRALKRMLIFNYLPIVLWIVVLVLAIIGFPSPFGSAFGVKEITEHFNFISFVTATSFGMWITIACLIINVWKVNDL